MLENCDKNNAFRFNFDACPMYQNLSGCIILSQFTRRVNTQLLICNCKVKTDFNKSLCVSTTLMILTFLLYGKGTLMGFDVAQTVYIPYMSWVASVNKTRSKSCRILKVILL